MSSITFTGTIADTLRDIAEQEKRPVEAILEDLLAQYQPIVVYNWVLQMAHMAEADTAIVWNETASDLAEQSRDILKNEFADYLLKRSGDG